MDSVDSCSALGTGNGQQSGSQSSQTQSSELIVWEIEVPKVSLVFTQVPLSIVFQACDL